MATTSHSTVSKNKVVRIFCKVFGRGLYSPAKGIYILNGKRMENASKLHWTPELRAMVKKIRERLFSPLEIKSIQSQIAQNMALYGQPKPPDTQTPP